ncbi:hypothetical protein PPH41_03090 [Burkholderia gladioli]|uniref:hypothetical protein n=1 Tax=Burkholderia gladioli TaxID=28095 RepID=UPI00297111A4|nr:hypothetical protein [Burkholderia gladioli]
MAGGRGGGGGGGVCGRAGAADVSTGRGGTGGGEDDCAGDWAEVDGDATSGYGPGPNSDS